MNQATITRIAITASALLFYFSLLFPVFTLADGEEYTALRALFIGWWGPMEGVYAWFANPLLALAGFFLIRQQTARSLCAILAALALTTSAFLIEEAHYFEYSVAVEKRAHGFYLWAGSQLCVLVGDLLVLAKDRRALRLKSPARREAAA